MAVATKHRAVWEKWHVNGTCSFSKEDPRELRSLNRHNVIKKERSNEDQIYRGFDHDRV